MSGWNLWWNLWWREIPPGLVRAHLDEGSRGEFWKRLDSTCLCLQGVSLCALSNLFTKQVSPANVDFPWTPGSSHRNFFFALRNSIGEKYALTALVPTQGVIAEGHNLTHFIRGHPTKHIWSKYIKKDYCFTLFFFQSFTHMKDKKEKKKKLFRVFEK